ncbi:class I SAM-dependent methyltransferase [Poseidonocella sedimentorum]|uniref:2-polyprenyl-3-methyl-5-hydroxy-6-metoxy-1,4-benzoquinol methylase n=1 Tax=Poseidonocella sedimentorum TaxID=871652 RepID=A0A1I6CXU7_9RHOB|nr:class I SAM-dependent methyltransferase [Poseidonocella sedimentorum]SFQ98058.1 2-polyprenyl-3-methyl-5-hydroxy-6-metoxy-1,4-benzoquinol methylase [Poseidonocella sedimentorum]
MTSHRFWDRQARKYAQSPISDEAAYEYTLERIGAYLTPEAEVLELGCGTGSTALRLAPQVRAYAASDYAPEMIAIAREKAEAAGAKTLHFRVAGAHEIAPEGRGWDAVIALNLLHLLPDPEAAVAHVHGLLKPGGLFISKTFCLPDGRAPLWLHAMRAALPVLRVLGKAPAVTFLKVAELDRATARAGFEILEAGNYPANPPRRFIVARKLDA